MLYTATIDYVATGEGRTIMLAAVHAESEEVARSHFRKEEYFGSYFARGMDVYEGMPPETDSAARTLLSDAVRGFLDDQADKPSCHLDVILKFHFNFS